jgi:hypothetical protein
LSDRPTVPSFGILQLFADITRFRKGPEDLPVSASLLGFCVVVGVAAQALLLNVLPVPSGGRAVAVLVIHALATLMLISVVLNLAKRPERFLQTATAAFGAQLVLLPLAVTVGWLYLAFSEDPVWKAPVLILRIMLEIWGLAIMARILNAATGWHVFLCVVLTITRDLVSMLALLSMFPPAVAGATPG